MIKDDLKKVLVENDEGTYVSDGKIYTNVDIFLDRFKDIDFKYDELKNHEKTTAVWSDIFDKWKNEGKLN